MSSSGQPLILKPGQSTKGTAPSAVPIRKVRVLAPLAFSSADIEAKLAAAARKAVDEKTPLSAGNSLHDDQKDLGKLRETRQGLPRPTGSISQRKEQLPVGLDEIKRQQAAMLNQLDEDFKKMRKTLLRQTGTRNIVVAAREEINAKTVRDIVEDADSPKQLVTPPSERPRRVSKPRALRKQSIDTLTIGFAKTSPKSEPAEPVNAPVMPTITITGP